MPEAILLQDVDGVGEKGTVVDVSKGYLRNFLIPRKLASPATSGAVQVAALRAAAQEKATRDSATKAHENADLLNKTVLTLAEKAGDDGRLFGSVTTQDIADAIKQARGLTIDKRHITLEEPIKQIGTFQVTVEVATGITAVVKTMVTELK
ncbi:MAG: 50S ribosomal protein L9 [Solirubrobacterales bacterium]|nr:50S ribosomal protein L9 [Solirubrobacterales bacterium]